MYVYFSLFLSFVVRRAVLRIAYNAYYVVLYKLCMKYDMEYCARPTPPPLRCVYLSAFGRYAIYALCFRDFNGFYFSFLSGLLWDLYINESNRRRRQVKRVTRNEYQITSLTASMSIDERHIFFCLHCFFFPFCLLASNKWPVNCARLRGCSLKYEGSNQKEIDEKRKSKCRKIGEI